MLKNLFAGPEPDKKSRKASFKRNDMVLTKETKSQICIIKTVRNENNGLEYGIITGKDSRIRWLTPDQLIKKLSTKHVIETIESLKKAFKECKAEIKKLQKELAKERAKSKECEQKRADYQMLCEQNKLAAIQQQIAYNAKMLKMKQMKRKMSASHTHTHSASSTLTIDKDVNEIHIDSD